MDIGIKERLKLLRSTLGLTQFDTADKTNIGRSTYAMFETGQRIPKDIHISQICTAFNVNPDWLRTGDGSMFCENDSSTLARLASEYHLDNFSQTVLASFLSLNEKSREAVLTFVKEIVVNVINDNHDEIRPHLMDEPAHAAPAKTLEEEAVEEAEAYRQEYLQAKKRQTSPASDSGNKHIG